MFSNTRLQIFESIVILSEFGDFLGLKPDTLCPFENLQFYKIPRIFRKILPRGNQKSSGASSGGIEISRISLDHPAVAKHKA